jgi:HAD superfamily hydrolase (TIGR01509 family)
LGSRLHLLQAFIFDLDGVLVDSYDCWRNLINDTLESQGKRPLSKEEFDLSWGQGPEADQQMFFPHWTIPEVLKFYEIQFPRYTRWAKAQPGITDLLKHLKARGKKIAVASNSPTGIVQALLVATELGAWMDVCVGVEEVAAAKPAPDLIRKAIEKLSVPIENACYIGDSSFDEQAACSAGILFIGFRRSGDYSIRDFEELQHLL